MVIGITGLSVSGKDTVAEYLAKFGFASFSFSDIIREYCRAAGKETTRENLIVIANSMRREHGADFFARELKKKIEETGVKKAIVVSMRNPDEVLFFKSDPNFKLISVEAPLEIRFARSRDRGRSEDKDDFKKFVENEEKERHGDAQSQQLDRVAAMADYVINNNGAFKDLYIQIDAIIFEIEQTEK